MKIYTEVNYKWLDGQLVKTDSKSFEYDGEVTLCGPGGGGGGGIVPKDPLKKLTETISETVKDVSDDFDKINNKRNTEIKNGKSTLQEINSIIDKIQTQAKELGIQPKNIPNFSKAIKSITELRSAANDIQKYSDFNL